MLPNFGRGDDSQSVIRGLAFSRFITVGIDGNSAENGTRIECYTNMKRYKGKSAKP